MFIKTANKYFLIFLIYIGTLWSWLQYRVFSLFSYWDELLALLFVPLFLLNIFKKKHPSDIFLWTMISFFVISGFVGNFTNHYTGIKSAVSDGFLNIKFFMVLYAVYYIYRSWNWKIYKETIKRHLDFLSEILLFLVVVDRVFRIFPVYEIRFGLSSEQLMFMHPSFCAAAFFYLLMLRIFFECIHGLKNLTINISLGIAILLTLRLKAIITMFILIAFLVYTYNPQYRKFKWPIIIVGIICGLSVAYSQIWGYFLSPYAMQYPRGALLLTSFKIVRDYFPFGTGFATYGSYLSGVDYSVVYHLYNIDSLPGMTQDNYNAICDQYWPMVAGQTGIVGLVIMVVIWYELYRKIKSHKFIAKNQLTAAIASIIYIVVCSTAESAICNPVCMPLAIILGLTYAQLDHTKRGKTITNE